MTARLPRPRIPAPPARLQAAWREEAACRGAALALFFPGRGESAGPARQICASCPVRRPCLDYAISHGITSGIWGGLADRDRRPLRTRQLSATRRERDAAIVAAAAAGFTTVAIGREFGLAATSVGRVLRRTGHGGTS